MPDATPAVDTIHAEMERARLQFRGLVQGSTVAELARQSSGTRWTNRELLFHMLFGFLITRALRVVIKIVAMLPSSAQRSFAAILDSATYPFDLVNYWGSRVGGRLVCPARMAGWLDRVVASLDRRLDRESDEALRRSMAFPTGWDPYFGERMSLAEVYQYATIHFDHHRRQLTLDDQAT